MFLSADYMVMKALRPGAADWNVLFASNAIVLMYGPKSKYGEEVSTENWTEMSFVPMCVGDIPSPTLIPAATGASWCSSLRRNSTVKKDCTPKP